MVKGKHIFMALGMALMLGACSAGVAPAATSNVQGATSAAGSAAGAVPTSMAVAGATDAPPAAGSADASCALVTSDAVATAGGFSVADFSGGGGTCIFQNSDKSKYLSVQLFKSQADMATVLQLESSSEHIAGLGDDAFWTSGTGGLFVRKGDRGIEFSDPDFALSSDTDTAARDAMVALARTALPNL
jgi:hypothetical protein